MRIISLLFAIIMIAVNAQASIIELDAAQTRFVAMRADKVNARSGPNTNYPITWIYQQQYYPVEIIAEYEQWRKIRDYEGDTSWIRKNLLSNTRYALIIEPGENNIYKKDDAGADIIAKVESGVIGKIKRCTTSYCLLEFKDDIRGWIKREALYGVKKDEIIN